MTDIAQLGYVRVYASDIDAWRKFAFDVIGFGEGTGPEEGALYLRQDERPARIVIIPSDEDRVENVGWEVRDGRALRRVQATVEESGVAVKPMSDDLLEFRRVEDGIVFEAPGGTPTEVFHGPALDHSPVTNKFGNRFLAGELGLGHVVVPVSDPDGAFRFYSETLDFNSRGAMTLPAPPEFGKIRIRFMSPNRRHHSLAIMPSPDLKAPALVHIMVELENLDMVGTALDRIGKEGYHLTSTLGRHTNDKMISFYVRTPGGWDLEVGCEGLLVDQGSYTAEHITADSYWGHKWDFSA